MRRQIRAVAALLGRRRKLVAAVTVPGLLLGVNVPPALALAERIEHQRLVASPAYQAQYGRWDVLSLPQDVQVNAVHAAMLPTGKLLIVAGSGNDQAQFDAGTFRTLIYDPATGSSRLVPTPEDMFCSGHAFLPDGKLLVAGGTQRYEKLAADVTHASGVIAVKNEFPHRYLTITKGTVFVAADGRRYAAANDVAIPSATKKVVPGGAVVTASSTRVFVESLDTGQVGVRSDATKYTVEGKTGLDAQNVYGMSDGPMTLDKQEYQGTNLSYEFDPVTESYVRVGDLTEHRWYPSLVGLPNGQVLAVSGLDGTGKILSGENEVFDPKTKTWTARPDLFRHFPTYPALFQTAKAGQLFYSGSNSGYGPATAGRQPGLWDLSTNTFTAVDGLRDPDLMETSGSGFAGPIQDQKVIVVGGGGVGESPRSTARIDVIDLKDKTPHFTAGPDLPVPTRYPNVVQLPDDSVLISNGSRDYRGKGASDNLAASIYHPDTNTLSAAADPTVGRDYHSEGLLLPTGQVMTLGGNSLFSDAADTKTAPFEKRLEIYTPPYLLHGPQPVIASAPAEVELGTSARVTSPQASDIVKARLVRPSAATHATDLEQRTVALSISHRPDGSLTLGVPDASTLVPPGYYMLFLVDAAGRPSVARWVHVH